MALPLKEAFTARALGVMWNSYQNTIGSAPFLGRSKFGTEKQDTMGLKFITGSDGMPVSLKASNFDAQAPLRDGGSFGTVEVEMPFYRESFMVSEKEEQEYADFVGASNDARANQILARIAKKPLNLVQGALVVPERQIWSLLAPANGVPRIKVSIEGVTYYVEYTPDAGVAYKQKHFKDITGTPANKWSASATATPLKDLVDVKQQFGEDTGFSLLRFSMNTITWNQLLNAEDTKKQVLGITAYNGGIRATEADVVAYLRDYGIEIEVYDKMYVDEAGQTQYFIPTGIISAQAAGVYLGTYTFGRTPEERSGNVEIGDLSIVETGVSIYTYTTPHPVNTHAVVSMLGLPTYEGMDGVCVMKVD